MKPIRRKRLAEIWCELNKHEVPMELKKPKSPWGSFIPNKHTIPIMMFIETLVTKEEIGEAWRKPALKRKNK